MTWLFQGSCRHDAIWIGASQQPAKQIWPVTPHKSRPISGSMTPAQERNIDKHVPWINSKSDFGFVRAAVSFFFFWSVRWGDVRQGWGGISWRDCMPRLEGCRVMSLWLGHSVPDDWAWCTHTHTHMHTFSHTHMLTLEGAQRLTVVLCIWSSF